MDMLLFGAALGYIYGNKNIKNEVAIPLSLGLGVAFYFGRNGF